MNRAVRILVLLACIAAAVATNLIACRWGTDCSDTTVLSISSQHNITAGSGELEVTGLFAAPWLAGHQLGATFLGVVLPMVLIGVGTYVAIRGTVETPEN